MGWSEVVARCIKKALVCCQGRGEKNFIHFLRTHFVGIDRIGLNVYLDNPLSLIFRQRAFCMYYPDRLTSDRDISGNIGMAEIIAQFYAQPFLANKTIAISD